ncbi:ABC transporter ATP-binding protein/permease [Falsiroseomonas selenitidurans]|uniref:ABC transporter ATP-binding protein/permease n=1 Tax=Falsiroseomonas selenitidurans TaxID=2716335 RepID=A0ABX1E8F4_9PROT|nr:ABC transporter ATP-binding protein/permease [Falsiroseomonas selenitidurans]NKC33045.1 ABC transporter ATP-binding protein/permease [Falsiroseomonas selenitidurans]
MPDPNPAAIDLPPQEGLMRRFWRLARGYYSSPGDRRQAWLLTAAVVGLTLFQIGVTVRFNLWNRDFFNALENRNAPAFYGQMWMFGLLLVLAMVAAVGQLWARQALMLGWRRWLVHRLQRRWLEGGRHYQLNFLPGAADNPDQRISENTRWATAMAVDLAIGLLGSILTLVSFLGILWSLSGPLHMSFGADEFDIPGYMVWAALLYAMIGSGLTMLIGGPMVAINIRRNEAESDHRFALIRMRENSEGIALIRGEPDEERGLQAAFGRVVSVMKALYGRERALMWLTSAYGMAASIIPILVASPRYFAGAITLGVLMQISSAFLEVTRALAWFVDNFPRLADWRSHVERVVDLEDTFDTAEAMAGEARIDIVEAPPGETPAVLAFRDLQVAHSDGNVVIQGANAEIRAAEKVLIVGESGTGKSTLFRAIAGLWPWGAGQIRIPPRDQMQFMPQRPYMPLGMLRAALTYPSAPQHFTETEQVAALQRCGLPHLVARLEEEERWDRVLSLGEQQRLAFARLLLHRPRWVFLDEATAALDEENQDQMMRLFREELAGSALISIGHRPGLDVYHDRTLQLLRAPDGARLQVRRKPRQKGEPLVASSRAALRRMLRRS